MNKINKRQIKDAIKFGGLSSALLLLTACDTSQLPVGAELRITPDSRTLNISDKADANGVCFIDQNSYVDIPIILSLVDSAGSPIGDTNISVYVDFSGNTFPETSAPVMALYDDRAGNNNGIIDDAELVSGVGDDIARVRTDDTGGDRPMLLRINTSCPFTGEIFAFTSGFTASSNIDVVLRGDEPTPTPDPEIEPDEAGDAL